ncbi:MAG: TIGR04255 family protein [Hyphomicrobiaceae bacterium]|nr:TIGR04255 family protein [Hyphomicrobiaceae bacterium]
MPVYKNPPIQEAVCEFTFAPLAGDPEWDLTLPGRLQLNAELREYAGKSRQQVLREIMAGDGKQPEFAVQQRLFRIHLPTEDGTALLSLGHNVLGVVALRPYEGWNKFRPRILRALKVFTHETGLTQVVRLGMRYINRVVTPESDASTGSKYIADMQTTVEAMCSDGKTRVEAKLTALNTRHEFLTADGMKIFVTQGTLNPEKAATAEYLLDIDTVCDQKPMEGIERITPVLERLHLIEGAMFERFITTESRKLFNAG